MCAAVRAGHLAVVKLLAGAGASTHIPCNKVGKEFEKRV